MRSRFAADVLPDGTRRYSRRAVVARRRLLVGVLGTGATLAVGGRLLGADGQDAVGATEAPGRSLGGHSLVDPGSPWVVVNKANPVNPRDYVPPALVQVGGKQVAAAIAPDLEALLASAAGDGLGLTLTSGYRSLDYQRAVHDGSVERNGAEVAETVSARPGYSEHQTGLAVDFGSAQAPGCELLDCFADTTEAAFLRAHATAHGFLLRYPADKTAVTGYAAESWHYRWVGRDLAAELAEQGVTTLEEFFDVPGGPDYV